MTKPLSDHKSVFLLITLLLNMMQSIEALDNFNGPDSTKITAEVLDKDDPSKTSVRICCPRGQYYGRDKICHTDDSVSDLSVNFTRDGENLVEGKLFSIFSYVVGKPCDQVALLNSWVLFSDGSVSTGQANRLSISKYCLNPIRYNDSFKIAVMICFQLPEGYTKDIYLSYGMFVNLPFLLATILVYIFRPKLRNVHGKSLLCYLFGLVVGYTFLGFTKSKGSEYVDPTLCRISGLTTYFDFMSVFFWLNVISFDLWWNFRNIHIKRNSSKTFLFYSIYAWGSTILMVGLCLLMQYIPNISAEFQPGIGIQTCFLGISKWSKFLYYYIPIILIMCCNSTFFLLTALKIRTMQKDIARQTDKEGSKVHRKNLDKNKANWTLFLRLFSVMGITWSMEAISFVVSPNSKFFYVTDALNAIQGVIIFFMLVVKGKAKAFIMIRWNRYRGKISQNHNEIQPTQTSMVDIELTSQNDNEV